MKYNLKTEAYLRRKENEECQDLSRFEDEKRGLLEVTLRDQPLRLQIESIALEKKLKEGWEELYKWQRERRKDSEE